MHSTAGSKKKLNSTLGSQKSKKSNRKAESLRKPIKRKSISRSNSRYRVRNKKPSGIPKGPSRKPPILKQTITSSRASSRNMQSRNTFSRATFGANTRDGSRKKSIVVRTPTLTLEDNENSTLEHTQVKQIYSELKEKSSQLNHLLEQLSQIVQV